ncbi:MAG: non-canonical purine NTP pyrophosphatase, RdgB/HAM1 family [Betaproteobacteria bacterium RIFCSPLOWO2_02_FULL_62_17]|nr:MAG: non-canonical purine NTP pyrophosphatase, RdgB/HAM1 family [Betaproteobacteria bacterium RIFCSPLOWO2_02_FULL_62_17]
MNKLVLASSNPGKLREISAVLAPLGIDVVPQSDLGIADAEEPFRTFIENALAKARHAARQAHLPALADDSGLCAHALGGEPGVHSARYATLAGANPGREEQDRRNNQKLVQELRDKEDFNAHYYCVIVLVRHAQDPEPVIAEGSWSGQIIAQPRGANGFGYDPHFLLPDLGLTAAELDPEQKNLISHRGKALRRLMARLREAR